MHQKCGAALCGLSVTAEVGGGVRTDAVGSGFQF